MHYIYLLIRKMIVTLYASVRQNPVFALTNRSLIFTAATPNTRRDRHARYCRQISVNLATNDQLLLHLMLFNVSTIASGSEWNISLAYVTGSRRILILAFQPTNVPSAQHTSAA